MNTNEVLKLALEALERHAEMGLLAGATITALREALAQDVPEVGFGNMALDKMAENARELGLDYEPVWDNLPSNKDVEDAMRLKRLSQLAEQKSGIKQVIELYDSPEQPAQQEPVAWMYDWICDGKLLEGWIAHKESEIPRSLASNIRPLYTSPPAQRTWVGLTDEEVQTAVYDENGCVVDYENYAEAIEAKLKEKNT